ncbi:hypothetical protein MTP03_14220 [Tsukamurella sp. PLM1]|nr:hypothetical protein MTP03_14220 [Tsukamurella sp. PLM1]
MNRNVGSQANDHCGIAYPQAEGVLQLARVVNVICAMGVPVAPHLVRAAGHAPLELDSVARIVGKPRPINSVRSYRLAPATDSLAETPSDLPTLRRRHASPARIGR